MIKIIWLGTPETLVRFLRFYEWLYKILGWFTALAALRFASVKTGNSLFDIIYGVLIGLLNIPIVYGLVFHIEIDYSNLKLSWAKHVIGWITRQKSPWVKYLIFRVPVLVLVGFVNGVMVRLITYIVNEIVKVQSVVKP
jgi:hypothetical protein